MICYENVVDVASFILFIYFYVFSSLKFGAYTVYLLGVCTTRLWLTQPTDTDNSIPPLELTIGAEASKLRAKPVLMPVQYKHWNGSPKPSLTRNQLIYVSFIYIYIYIY